MGNRSSGALVVIGGVLLLAVYAVIDLLLSSGNLFSRLSMMLMVPCGLAGLMSRRAGFMLFLISCGYVDLLKRLLAVDGIITKMDLYFVLGIPPMTLAAVLLSTLAGAFSGTVRIRSGQWAWLGLAGVFMVLTIVAQVRESGWGLGELLPALANSAFYTSVIFVVPVLYPDSGQLLRMLRTVTICYVPVAVYGVYQQIYGYQEFEIAYLLTGLSIEIKQLLGDDLRAFSTLNSPTALAAVSMTLALVSMMLMTLRNPKTKRHYVTVAAGVLLVLAFLGGWAASTSRSAALILVMGMMGWWAFRSTMRTSLMYSGLAAAFVGLLLFAQRFLDDLRDASLAVYDNFGTSQFGTQLTRIGTFTERLQGFTNLLTNPDFFTPFGYGAERGVDPADPLYNHDMLSNWIVHYGVVPVALGAIFALITAVKVHRRIVGIQSKAERSMAAGCMGVVVGMIASSMMSGSLLTVFPNNVFFWLMFAGVLVGLQSNTLAAELQKKPPAPAPAPVSPHAGLPAYARHARGMGTPVYRRTP